MLLVCFTFGIIASGYRYWKTQKLLWALLAGLFLGLTHATKETCIISFASMLLALAIIVIKQKNNPSPLIKINKAALCIHVPVCLFTALVVSALFYSSFFKNPQGILDSFTTYASYFYKASNNNAHIHPWYYYLKMLIYFRVGVGPVWSEAFIVILAFLGFIGVATKKYMRHFDPFLVRFIALYTLIMTIIYSAIPYKTPWSMLGFYHGIILMAAVGMSVFIQMATNRWRKIFIWFIITIGFLFLIFQSYLANFYLYADPIYPYVYAHTSIDIYRLNDKVQKVASVHPDKQDMYIQVIFPAHNYWPLPWYLRSFNKVSYQDQVDPSIDSAPVIIASPELKDELLKTLYELPAPGDKSLYVPLFNERLRLRPGIDLIGLIKKDLYDILPKNSDDVYLGYE
jgi:uncharacterized protein (TIGR03663 family)